MKVLFVDDEVMILNALKRTLFKTGWDIYLAKSGVEALQILKQKPFDFIVSDMRMPGMCGDELLEKVSELYPQTVRIILSGFSNEEAAKKASFVAHQWLDKPCEPELLKSTIEHINNVRTLLPQPKIQNLVGKIKMLPSPPKIYMRLQILLNDNVINMEKMSQVISEDPALVAKLLQLTNSSFFTNSRPVASLSEAITRLGEELVCSIVIAAETFSQLEDIPGLRLDELQKHSLKTARLAATMVDPPMRQNTLISGLLHNIGKFILYKVCPKSVDICIKKVEQKGDDIALEQEICYTDHVQLAGYLLHLWNFSYTLIENIVLHRQPLTLIKRSFGSSAAIYIASQLLLKRPLNDEFIRHFKIEDKLINWKKKANEYS